MARAREGEAYFERIGLLGRLRQYANGEIDPDFADLQVLHETVVGEKSKRPAVVLEFGVGFSTLVMAHAISTLDEDRRARSMLCSVDTSQKWIGLTRDKIPEDLRRFVTFHHSDASMQLIGNQLCSLYDSLPNLRPNLIYLDGPDPVEVKGDIRGLRFVSDDGRPNKPLSADILTYEWILDRGTRIVVDGRNTQVRFLLKNLKRDWTLRSDPIGDRHILRLDN